MTVPNENDAAKISLATDPMVGNPMESPASITDSTIYITDSAVNRLRVLRQQEQAKNPEAKYLLRISVLSGGCYGFQYNFDFVTEMLPNELCFTFEDLSVVTDEVSYELLKDVTLDYVQELIGAAFTLRNPNSDASCGCGNSFSI